MSFYVWWLSGRSHPRGQEAEKAHKELEAARKLIKDAQTKKQKLERQAQQVDSSPLLPAERRAEKARLLEAAKV